MFDKKVLYVFEFWRFSIKSFVVLITHHTCSGCCSDETREAPTDSAAQDDKTPWNEQVCIPGSCATSVMSLIYKH